LSHDLNLSIHLTINLSQLINLVVKFWLLGDRTLGKI
jgi:hypothetical protein